VQVTMENGTTSTYLCVFMSDVVNVSSCSSTNLVDENKLFTIFITKR